jgi:hypothetical protein
MAYPTEIKIGNITENWLFQFGYFNGDAQGNGDGAFSPVTQANGNPNLLDEALDSSETGIDVDDGTVFVVGDFIKVDNEIMKVTAISTNTLTVEREKLGTSASTHTNDTQIYWNNFLGLSFEDTQVDGTFYFGAITNNPSLRESIDLTQGTAKSSNATVNIPDFTYKGEKISKELFGGTNKYINQEVRVFAVINGQSPNRIQTFRLTDIKFNGHTLSLSLVTSRPWDFLSIPQRKTERNNYFPVAYGLYTPNDTTIGSEDFCPSKALYAVPIELRGSSYIRCLQPQSISSEARLHFYEKDVDAFVPLTRNDYAYRDTAVTSSNGHATLADSDLFRGFYTKGLKEEATSNSLFSDGSLAVDNPTVAQTSGTHSEADMSSGGVTTEETDEDKSLYLECPNITGTVTLGKQQFYIRHRADVIVDNIQLTGASVVKGLNTNTVLNTIQYAPIAEGANVTNSITTSLDTLTLSDGQLPTNYGILFELNADALEGAYNVSTECEVYDARLLVNASLNFANNKEGAYSTINSIKELYCGADGLTRSWSSGSCAEIQEAHLDILMRFVGMTQKNGSTITDPTNDSQVYGWGSLDTARNGWNLRYWTYKEVEVIKVLERMAYEGGFIFRFKADGTPQYIHIANSPSTDYTLSIDDISTINISSMPFSELVTKRNIEYEKHPAESRYISTLTTEDTTNNIRKKWNIKEKENIEEIKLDMLVGNVGDEDCGDGNPNDSFANYYYNITGDIKLIVSCEIVNPKFYDMEVGDIIEFDENNMFPETPMGHNSATWNNLQMMVTSTNRTLGKLSITAREI